MSTPATSDLEALKQLHSMSANMLAFAKSGSWDSVLDCDHKRLSLLKEYKRNSADKESAHSHQLLIDEILEFDKKIKELANDNRQLLMDNELRLQAQISAKNNYKQALSSKTGL